MQMSSITEPISVFDFRTGSGQKAQEPVFVEMSAQAPRMDPPVYECNILQVDEPRREGENEMLSYDS